MNLINKNYKNIVSIWLLGSITLVFFMIIIGGLTRLTDSGLSITEWELFKGIFPPFNEESWNEYFNLYKTIPQFKLLYPDMTLNEFKVIFYWEYFHRLLGRLIGLFFLLPLIYFTYKKVFEKKVLITLYFIFFLIVFQGIIGWYMVESGLINEVTVSHYRLSLHLFIAFIIISILFWNYLNFENYHKQFLNLKNKMLKLLLIIVFLQIILGAFVSGLDAGMVYQTWPKMNLSFFPDDINLKDYGIISLFDQQSFVQFIHRLMAYGLFFLVILIGYNFYLKNKKPHLLSYLILFSVIIIQILLGIFTLVSGLNVYLASMHQITSIVLVFSVLNLNHKFS